MDDASLQMGSEESLKAERIEAAIACIAAHVPAAEGQRLAAFAREYLRQVDPEDVLARTPEELAGALLSHWQFGQRREPGRAKVRVLSPAGAEHGWSSRHTVIEIVNDDMPFLVDSVTMELSRRGTTLHLIVHPVFAVTREADGTLRTLAARHDAPQAPRESWMHLEIDRLPEADQRAALLADIERVLQDVRAAVTDFAPMLARLRAAADELEATAPASIAEEAREGAAFLRWLANEHLVLLGSLQHELVLREGVEALRLVPGSGLGLLREPAGQPVSASFAALTPAMRALARQPSPTVIVTKANTRSTVHRPGYTDYIGVKRFDAQGRVVGEHRFIGLFTSTAYMERVAEIPILRGKVAAVRARAGLTPGGHLDKALAHILETYPRDELFQITVDELYETAMGILRLGQRQKLRLFVRRDPFERFVSCLVYVPRDAYHTELRRKFQELLLQAFAGTQADFDVLLTEAILARVHFVVRTTPGAVPTVDLRRLERQLAAVARRWDDDLRDALVEACGEAQGLALFCRWAGAFPAAYRERTTAAAAVADLLRIDALGQAQPVALSFYRPLGAPADRFGFKVYRRGQPLALTESLPMLEHLGVKVLAEARHAIGTGAEAVWLHDFALQAQVPEDVELEVIARRFEDCFLAVLEGRVEDDDFNRLVLRAALAASEIVILRAYARYFRQIGFALSQRFIESTLAAHPQIARMLVRLFGLRFDPAAADAEAEQRQAQAIEAALARVADLSEDRVLRQYLAAIRATVRTNFWRTGAGSSGATGPRRSFLSFKFDGARMPGLPPPRPYAEIFVYSPRFEGVHLRGGKVARGGIRWSDRPEDFRTEVLGLMKAQMVKNTVIVPVGSKGGFVLKRAPADRDALLAEGIACYQDYLRGLLDLTDNRQGDRVLPPPQVVRHDDDDPYLVVAADKGTATFSDYANAVAREYDFWLGDAFASGGSAGFDHKKMGITARGTWESVKRHFRELGIDTQRTDFTVVGIGDMSGDVFGNGMLLSRHIKLVAAFDHRHIFIDPDPDPARSWEERRRLFELPRSSWADYDPALISAGGGVWPRSAKHIPISPQARQVLGIDAEALTPNELISAILRAPVDLLYNGGIGTYVKASTESHAEVGDRANDAVRVNGCELRCRVVAEGGNLGFTQRGRIEAALAGVRLNTDAIDNSAGVDTSDHEVNIKILLGLVMADGELTEKQRNALLSQMTDEVAALVLRDNYFQTQIISLTRRAGPARLDAQARFVRFLVGRGLLNRELEFLPSEEEFEARKRRGVGLTNPELAVLLAYSKMWLYDEVLASDLPDDPWVGTALARYFPQALRERFAAWIPRHPLRREIVSTHVVNSMVNRVGMTFVHRLMETTGATPPQIVRAYLLARESFGHVDTWRAIEALDNVVPDDVQAQMLMELDRLTLRATRWFVRQRGFAEPMAATIARFTPAAAAVLEALQAQAGAAQALAARAQPWVAAGVPQPLAWRVAASEALVAALDAAELAAASGRPLPSVAALLVALSERLQLARLRAQIAALPVDTHWQALARTALTDELNDLLRALAARVLETAAGDDALAALAAWENSVAPALTRVRALLAELALARGADLAMLSVVLRALRNLA